MSLRNGVFPSPIIAVWSLAAVLLLAAGSLPLQAQEYTPLPGLRVSDGRVQFLFASAGQCINLNSTINGVAYTTHTSKWQRRAGSSWVDIPGTESEEGLCGYSATSPGEYRVVAEISIDGERGFYSSENTFIVEGMMPPPVTGGPTYYFPHLAVGASWQTTITYINYSSEEVTCQTDFLSDDGSPLMVSFADKGTVPSRTDVLLPGGSVHQETNVELSAPLAPGWARATCSGPVKASLLFRQHNSAGVPVAEAAVNAATIPATRFVTFAEQGEGKSGTGVAYANPYDTAALVTFTVRDAAGEMLDSFDQSLMAGEHGAENMATLFDLSSFTGSLEVTSTVPIVTLSLNFEAAPVFSSLPPGELDASAQGSTTYYFPHLAVGAGWQTTITYINYSPQEVTCQTEFISDHGSPLLVSFADRGTGVDRTDVLPPGGSVHQETNVELSAPLAPGWARATCSGPVKASLLFRQFEGGVPTAEAAVNAAAVPATRFVTFAEQQEDKAGTGVAYANPSTTAAMITFTAKDAAGQTLASVERTLLSKGHDAQNMATLFDLSSFTGSLEITSTEPIVSLSLNFEADPVFSSLPPGELDAADIPGGGNNFGVGDALPGVPTAGQLFPVSGWATEWSGVTFSATTDRSTTYLTFDDGGYIQLQTGTRYTCRATGGCRVGNGVISRGTIVGSGGTPAPPPGNQPDLVVQTPSVSDSSPNAGETFTLSATVRNQGNGLSASSTLRYYRSLNADISTGDTLVGTDAVSGLAASGVSDESISLTAPSSAGTYYYGACVDSVSGESDAGNNCSRAVSVTVTTGSGSGGLPAGESFDLDSANGNANGITFANNRFYVPDAIDDKVYAYSASGQREPAADFDLHADNADPSGITFANSRFFVVDFADDKVYAYSASGQRESAAGFDLHADNEWQAGITFANNRFFVPDATDDKVYAYSASGQRESAADFALHVDSGNPRGITFTNNRFFVVDTTDDKVYVLNPTAPDLVVESPSVSSSTPATGQSFEFRATVRNQGPSTSTATTLRYYRSDDRTISTSDTQVGTGAVGALPAAGTSSETITLPAPSTEGTYYYGACVDSVSGESATQNNCSSAVVVFGGGPFPAYDLAISSINLDAPSFAIIGSSSIKLTVSVTNSGPNASRPAKLRFSGGRSFDLDIPVLEPDGTMTYESQTVGTARLGTTTYRACIAEAPGEEKTDNNCRSRSVTYLLN